MESSFYYCIESRTLFWNVTDIRSKTMFCIQYIVSLIMSYNFGFQGHPVCRKSFMFLHNISEKRYKNLCKHFDKNGLTPRVHGNTGRRPVRSFGPETERHALVFIEHYAAVHAMPMPGRMPNIRDYSVMMLPSDTTKAGLWEQYKQACEESNETYVRYTLLTVRT